MKKLLATMLLLLPLPSFAGIITLEQTYSGPINGTGTFTYDDVTDQVLAWDWFFPGVGSQTGFANIAPFGAAQVVLSVFDGTQPAAGFFLSSSQITGFPGDTGRDFLWRTNGTFFIGDLSSQRGLNGIYTSTTAPVPEPTTFGLLGLGAAALLLARRRKA